MLNAWRRSRPVGTGIVAPSGWCWCFGHDHSARHKPCSRPAIAL